MAFSSVPPADTLQTIAADPKEIDRGTKSERGLPLMGLMETVEIREQHADSHRSHKPGGERSPRASAVKGWRILPESCISVSAKTAEAGGGNRMQIEPGDRMGRGTRKKKEVAHPGWNPVFGITTKQCQAGGSSQGASKDYSESSSKVQVVCVPDTPGRS